MEPSNKHFMYVYVCVCVCVCVCMYVCVMCVWCVCDVCCFDTNIIGTTIYNQGDIAEVFYIITRGRVHVFIPADTYAHTNLRRAKDKNHSNDDVLLDTLQKGDWFGDISLLENTCRTASVKTIQDTGLLCVCVPVCVCMCVRVCVYVCVCV